MTEALLVSNALLWAVVLILAAVVAALTRQIGVLHERVAPAGALAVERGPEVGEAAPQMNLVDVRGQPVGLGGADEAGRHTLLFFLSPTCPVCETLLPTLRRIAAEQTPRVRVLYASDGEPEEHARFIRAHDLEGAEYVLSRKLGIQFAVAKLPYAVLIDSEGTIRAKGLVNTREHLESLFEANRLGVASIQEYLAREQGLSPEEPPLETLREGAAR